MKIDDWLDEEGAPEADWGSVVLDRAMNGLLGHGEDGILLDMLALTQPHACRPHLCSPGLREAGRQSCCADLDVGLADEEVDAIEEAMPEIAALMRDDPRWPMPWHDDGFLERAADPGEEAERCVFAKKTPQGLRCALHALELQTGRAPGTLKPIPCRLFPLALVEMDEDSWLLTAVHTTTWDKLDSHPAAVFPCLSGGAPPLYVAEREVIEQVFGPALWRAIDETARSPDEA